MIKKLKQLLCYCLLSLLVLANPCHVLASQNQNAPTSGVRIYTLNCGYIDIHDFASFSDTNLYPHHSRRLADPCFLIKNPKGLLLWDLGLGDQYVNRSVEDKKYGVTLTVPISLTAQLKQLGLTPNDIKYVGISHSHFDHTGNANLFPHATWLVQRAEYQYTQQKPFAVAADTFQTLTHMNKILLDGDYDVFGDGTAVILRTPGHTPGHQSLEVVLPHHGVMILSGDLYHARESYLAKQVPAFNTSRAETLASMSRISGLLSNTRGHLIIQHDLTDFTALPKLPKYLD